MDKPAVIAHHNVITTARYEYTETQLNIFFFLLSQLRKDDTDGVYELRLKDFTTLTGKEYSGSHIDEATEDMAVKPFISDSPEIKDRIFLFQRIKYIKGAGVIYLKLTEDIRPFLFDLKNNFTRFELYSALRLTSKFAKRVYTLCSQWKSNGVTQRYDLVDFKTMLGLYDPKTGNEKFKTISSFKIYVLDEAVKQINEFTDLRISYQLKKEGRSFKWLTFSIKVQEGNIKLPDTLSKGKQKSATEKPAATPLPLSSGHTTFEQLVNEANSRGCIYNGTDLSKVYNTMVAWGASPQSLQLIFSSDEFIDKYLKWSRPFITNQVAPEFGVSEFLAMIEEER